MKIIKVSDSVHKRLTQDKKQFAKDIGIFFTFDRTIAEYIKILDGIEEEDKKYPDIIVYDESISKEALKRGKEALNRARSKL